VWPASERENCLKIKEVRRVRKRNLLWGGIVVTNLIPIGWRHGIRQNQVQQTAALILLAGIFFARTSDAMFLNVSLSELSVMEHK
jgi:hypothetical protein